MVAILRAVSQLGGRVELYAANVSIDRSKVRSVRAEMSTSCALANDGKQFHSQPRPALPPSHHRHRRAERRAAIPHEPRYRTSDQQRATGC